MTLTRPFPATQYECPNGKREHEPRRKRRIATAPLLRAPRRKPPYEQRSENRGDEPSTKSGEPSNERTNGRHGYNRFGGDIIMYNACPHQLT
jgi:hypothetical protein